MIRCALPLLTAVLLAVPAAAGTASLDDALASKADLWGDAAMRQSNGPSCEFFADLLPPLRYVNAQFRYYPIVLCAPGSLRKARLISDGSAINARAGLGSWRDIGLPARFYVGEDEAPFRADPKKLAEPAYERGYLPIVQIACGHGDRIYTEETFAAVASPLAEHAVLLTRFGLQKGTGGIVFVHFETNAALQFVNGSVRDNRGRAWAWCDKNWRWDATRKSLTAAVSAHRPACLAIATVAMDPPGRNLDYAAEKRRCARRWEALIAQAARIEVPEPMVNDAWKSAVVGSFMLLKGDRMNYGADTVYEQMFEAECGDVVRALASFGLTNEAAKMIPPLLDYSLAPGLQFHDAGFKLQLLADYYWLTRDANFVRVQRPRWRPAVEKIMRCPKSAAGLLPRELSDGDNNLLIDSLSSNANAWRGLRDIAAVLEDMGEAAEAESIRSESRSLRKAILAAVAKTVYRDTTPPFVPLALFSHDPPYDVLTGTRLGSYWNLMICYVLGSGVFGSGSETEGWIIHYLQEHGGLCMGLLRISQHSGLFANDDALDDLYTLRYADAVLQRDEPERALVSFYGKLAQGMTRNTFLSAEGTGLRPLDEFGRPMYLPPTCSGSGFFLHLLRTLLIQDYVNDEGEPKSLRLLFATPRRWLEDGREIRIQHAPTAFGPISVHVKSRLNAGQVLAEIEAPMRNHPGKLLLRIRLPEGWSITSAKSGSQLFAVDDQGTVDISALRGKFTVRFTAKKA